MRKVLLTVDRSHDRTRITDKLTIIQELYASYHDIDVVASVEHQEGPPIKDLQAAVDVLVIDGHGTRGALRPDILMSIYANTVVAPVLVTGWCWAARSDYAESVAGLLAIDHAVVIGSADKTQFRHAEKVYPAVINAVLKFGTDADDLISPLNGQLQRLRYKARWRARKVARAST